MNNNIPVITIDGPSAAGKSTICNIIANKLNWCILESGLIYRFLAILILQRNVPIIEKNIISFLKNLDFSLLKENKISKVIPLQIVGETASKLATFSETRKILLYKQRCFRKKPGLIAEGRDMGTVVFPDAIIKFFFKANLETRVFRRIKQFKKMGLPTNYKKSLEQLKIRDERDQNRLISPLYASKDAIILDSTNMTLSEVIECSMKEIKKKINI
ncbi:(d)CMP kinase [Buchnera aphidicola]|uniref:Cytidylate kinase n=1 Tax=Buchnera aphidicola (Aphis gossypii) TaxID=98785 RepID=A0A5J6ZBZ8_9GAMM|nr:(d)CMP kinase [Buchnera aphidicola]QFQ32138.1 (d)CMP kinase [Buchnera aphidicola (Aphis gossypii)]